jgi:hypothetical protein
LMQATSEKFEALFELSGLIACRVGCRFGLLEIAAL